MNDRDILRDLTQEYVDICNEEVQAKRRQLWRRHNSLIPTRPLIYIRRLAWPELSKFIDPYKCKCEDPFFRFHEDALRRKIYWRSLNDDSVFEPWITQPATYKCLGWGLEYGIKTYAEEDENAVVGYHEEHPFATYEDMGKLRVPFHEIDEQATAESLSKLHDAVGDLIEINLDRCGDYRSWDGDVSYILGHLRGMESIMYDIIDHPEELHKLLAFLRDGILKAQDEAEACGDFGLHAHENQSMPYAEELKDPAANTTGAKLNQLWGYGASEEFTMISPDMHEEFLLEYQLPVLRRFGLTAYGCCEDLTHKIDMLRKIPNLRRIAVSPFANTQRCAEQIGSDYVSSFRPHPTPICCGFDQAQIKKDLTRDLQIFKANACHPDITLKDVETVDRDPARLREWVTLTREAIEEVW